MEGVLMIMVALLYDGLQFLIELSLFGFGWTVNWIITVWAWLTFYVWFKFRGVSFIRPRRALAFGGGFLIELIPWINNLPTWTGVIIFLLLETRIKKAVGGVAPQATKRLSIINRLKRK